MGSVLSFAPSATLRRRTSEAGPETGLAGPRPSAKLEFVFAQIHAALGRRERARTDLARAETAQGAAGDETSMVDCLLGRCCSQK